MKKFIIIFVILLIIVLGIAFFTQNKSKDNYPTPSGEDVVLSQGVKQCYIYSQVATAEDPYTVNETVEIVVNGENVSGTKLGTQTGPDMTNGYVGTLSGTIKGNIIDVVYAYIIEGAENKEQEIYQVKKDLTGIEKLRYPLKESGGMLVPDTKQDYKILSYNQVDCEIIN